MIDRYAGHGSVSEPDFFIAQVGCGTNETVPVLKRHPEGFFEPMRVKRGSLRADKVFAFRGGKVVSVPHIDAAMRERYYTSRFRPGEVLTRVSELFATAWEWYFCYVEGRLCTPREMSKLPWRRCLRLLGQGKIRQAVVQATSRPVAKPIK